MGEVTSKANELGKWQNNAEINPNSNSSITDDGLLEDKATRSAGHEWRDEPENDHIVSSESSASGTGDPGRTPGKAEGVENPEDHGNQ